MTRHPVARQLRTLLWSIAGCLTLLVLAYAGQVYIGQQDRRVLNDLHGQGSILALSMHDAFSSARALTAIGGMSPAEEGAFAAANAVAFGRTLDYGDRLLALYRGVPGPELEAGRRRLERALEQLRALRVEFQHDDLGLARAFATRPLYVGIVSLQLEQMHAIASKELSAAIERRTRISTLLFIGTAVILISGLGLLAGRYLRTIDATLERETETLDALRRSEARLEEAQRLAQVGSWELDPASGRMTLSTQMGRMLGLTGATTGTDHSAFLAAVHPDDRARVAELMSGHANGRPVELVHRLRPSGGTERVVMLRGWGSGEGGGHGAFGTMQDITERRALETHLLQAQKMESVGRLAGGVAHDFNNMLTAIINNIVLALDDLPDDDPRRELLTEAAAAAHSAAQTTRQLLTFSRRQIIDPRVLDLNDVVGRVQKILQRLLGEDVRLRTVLQPKLGLVRIDVSQIEQALINLAVNARDAMPDGGTLTIETADVALNAEYCRAHPHLRPGEFVMLSVVDDGKGLTDEDKAHLFEPFYTTKPPGHGTGLGLSMVYGAVKQHGGSIEAESTMGAGTTFRIYLPRVDAAAQPPGPTAPGRPRGGTETIVLVEDQDSVRSIASRLLRRWGYTVHAFPSAEAMLAALGTMEAPMDLLVTDVVLPDLNGPALVERVRELLPGLPVLFTSGYTGTVLARHGVLDPGIEFLPKPYSGDALARRVRELLDRDRSLTGA